MDWKFLLQAIGAGIIAAMRAASAPALVNTYLMRNFSQADLPQPAQALRSPRLSPLLELMALGELAADKLPFLPNRTDPPSLIGRTFSGALAGAALGAARHQRREWGAIVGGLSAALASFVLLHLRLSLGRNTSLPDPLVGALEDSVILSAYYNIQN